MNIKEYPIKELIPYENNPRNNKEAVEYVANSIREFGFKVPIVIDKDMVIVAGHTRLLAAEKLGLESVPCIVADDLTPDQIKAFRLADNKTGEFASWDFEKLEFELDELSDFDMEQFGFTFEDEDEDIQIIEDEVPEVQEKTTIQRGDVFELGNHRLMCGDATNKEEIETLINGEEIDLVLTDPPYGIDIISGGAGTIGTGNWPTGKVGGGGPLRFGKNRGGKTHHNRQSEERSGGSIRTPKEKRITEDAVIASKTYRAVIGDDTTETAKNNYLLVKEISKNQILFGGNYFTDFLFPSKCWIVWDKNNTGNFADAELAWTSFDKGVKLYKFTWNGLVREGSREVEGITRVHPTQKPVGMLANILKDFSHEGDKILDCFGGSGSTLIACEQLGRKCYMAELDPHYCDVIIKRWENLTGKKAKLINRS